MGTAVGAAAPVVLETILQKRSQRLTCPEENKLIISRAQDERFQCQTNLTIESWETIGRGKVKNNFK